jgi:hypothetical protein
MSDANSRPTTGTCCQGRRKRVRPTIVSEKKLVVAIRKEGAVG